MNRRTVLVALFATELVIVALAVEALRGGGTFWPSWSGPGAVSSPQSVPLGAAASVEVAVPGIVLTLSPSGDGNVHVSGPGVRVASGEGGVRVWRVRRRTWAWFSTEAHAALQVPPRTPVDVTAARGFEATGMRDDLDVHLDKGSLAISDHEANRLRLVTENGRISLRDVGFREPAPTLEATSGNGRVDAELKQLPGDGRYMLHTDNGRMRVRLPADGNATIRMRTGRGTIQARGVSVSGEGGERRAVVGEGAAPFELSTGNGSIKLAAGTSE